MALIALASTRCFASEPHHSSIGKKMLTSSGGRLNLVQENLNSYLNWIFVPGGPGLGSESLSNLTKGINLPGKIWHFDFPGDGSNLSSSTAQVSIQNWKRSLIEAVTTLKPAVLVAHSFGGMFVLSLPELEEKLRGLILFRASPDRRWEDEFNKYSMLNPIPGLTKLQTNFKKHPTNEGLKDLTTASSSYFFSSQSLEIGKAILDRLPFNAQTFLLAQREFHPNYKAVWVPHALPTLILGGSEDRLTPLRIFEETKNFHRPNITIKSIEGGSHFPWLERKQIIMSLLQNFYEDKLR